MQELFQVAKEHKPCVIHFDEIHALFGSSVADDSEIEWVRRMKTEFLVQVEQLSHDSIGIFIIASTHKPWLLDTFVRRRLNIRIYTPLPDVQARALIFKQKLGTAPHSLIDEDFWFLAESSEGFSGTDIKIVVRDALMQPGRKVQAATHFRNVSGTSKNSNGIIDDLLTPCSLVYPGAIAMRFSQVPPNKLVEPGVEKTDILIPLQTHKITVTAEDLAKLQQFYDDYVAY